MRTRVFIVALLLGSSGRAAEAQSLRLPPVRYEAPASCPSRDFFLERLRARLLADRVRALTSLRLTVELEPGPSAVRGSVQVDRGETRARRILNGPTCREVVEGLALIAALAVTSLLPSKRPLEEPARPDSPNPGGDPDVPPADPSPPPSAAGVDQEAAAENEVDPARAGGARPARMARPRSPEDGPAPAPAARSPEPPLERDDPALRTPPRARDERPTGATWSVGLSLLGLHGVAPAFRPGLQLQAALVLPGTGVDWSLRIGGRISLPQSLRSSGGTATFAFAAGVAQLCVVRRVGSSPVALEGCAVAEPGLLHASGEATDNPGTYDRPWLAAGAGASVGWRAAGWLVVRAGAEALVPTRRDRMLLAGVVLHRVPPVVSRLHLALEVPIE